jgi:hypothetical protein
MTDSFIGPIMLEELPEPVVFTLVYPLVRPARRAILRFMSPKTIVSGMVVAALAAGAGVWAWSGYQKKQHQQAVIAAVGATTVELRAALSGTPGTSYKTIDGKLGAVKAAGWSPLTDAAEQYIVGAREIARQRAEGARLAREAAAGRQALTAHMRSGARRTPGWFTHAVGLKKKVEQDHRELERSLKALEELLTTLPEASKRLEPHVARSALLDDAERQRARARAQDDARRAAAELTKVRNLTP